MTWNTNMDEAPRDGSWIAGLFRGADEEVPVMVRWSPPDVPHVFVWQQPLGGDRINYDNIVAWAPVPAFTRAMEAETS